MKFKLDFDIRPPLSAIHIRQQIMLVGSCFAEHIGDSLRAHKFNVMVNPNGILFNPASIIYSMQCWTGDKLYTESDLFQHNGLWYSWQHHGSFANKDKSVVRDHVNAAAQQASQQFRQADHLIITLGSAYVYELKETQQIVANCHKVPQQHFHKRLLNVKEIVGSFEKLLEDPAMSGKQVIFTVSPVRYIRDGVVENNHSKAVLIRAVHELVGQRSNCYYFPAYEIVMDELRDYRFFEADMVHPNAQAIGYVWERFCNTVLDAETLTILNELKEIIRARKHRPLHPETEGHRIFLSTWKEKTATLAERYPFLDLAGELDYFSVETHDPGVH